MKALSSRRDLNLQNAFQIEPSCDSNHGFLQLPNKNTLSINENTITM